MILQSPGEVAFKIFDFTVYFYGIILAFACLLAVYAAKQLYCLVYKDRKANLIWDVAPIVVISGIIGARLYYCLVNFDYYAVHPLEIFYLRGGGLSVHGGIIAGIIALWISSKKYKLSFLRLLDVFAVGTVLAQSFGRWGNFFNNEAFGLPYDGFLKLFIPVSQRPIEFIQYSYFHPAFLYESVLDFCIFVILIFIIKKFGAKVEGLTLSLYFIFYSIARFAVESIRIDSALDVGNFHIAQLVSIALLAAGIITFVYVLLKYKFSKTCNN